MALTLNGQQLYFRTHTHQKREHHHGVQYLQAKRTHVLLIISLRHHTNFDQQKSSIDSFDSEPWCGLEICSQPKRLSKNK